MTLFKTHNLKILPRYFSEVVAGNKTFEVREKDRDFKVGDEIILNEYDGERGFYYTGYKIAVEITYILDNPEYLKSGYVILGIKRKWLKCHIKAK